ncbi:hypothetical protein SSCG_03215 [Streptomyces clavuligerus]|nr:hypothetical protein SSCG_03215 [Streptomyces clavuligerus]
MIMLFSFTCIRPEMAPGHVRQPFPTLTPTSRGGAR